MLGLLQRVNRASVSIRGNCVAGIDRGLLVLVGVERHDDEGKAGRLIERLLGYRVFPDEQGRMNRSLAEIKGGLLLVPQFTLAADTRKGTRPGFSTAAEPARALELFAALVDCARSAHANVGAGEFGADMQVELINDGPVTFLLQVP
ncbi:MAG TPA: D-aminoacyl-tRNA deacylase [Nevskiaceae bacterium]|nr:D-aminoacyl-tRNA deacylase [Nevskiaceae bacterium]